MRPLIAVVGPTAVGKSPLALRLAEAFGGEILSADSRQVYRYLDIGTAKPSLEDQRRVPHHLIDVADPDETFTLAIYQDLAQRALTDMESRGRQPFLVGGSGLYVRAVTEGLALPRVPPDAGLRRRLEARAAAEGGDALYQELCRVDRQAAERIDPRNLRRVIRALEVAAAGRSVAARRLRRRRTLFLGLTASRPRLYEMVDHRVEAMMERGLLDEVRSLVERGYGFDLPAMSGLGYRQIGEYLRGEVTLEEAVRRIKTATHRFVRQQYTWFRLSDGRIHWFDVEKRSYEDDVRQLVERSLEGSARNAEAVA